jgi:hypothetical protein
MTTVVDSEVAILHLQDPEAAHSVHPLGMATAVKVATSEVPVVARVTIAEVRTTYTVRMVGLVGASSSSSSGGVGTAPHSCPGLQIKK